MNNLWTDTGYISLNHVNEQLCGDRVEIIGNNEKSLTMVLADGLGQRRKGQHPFYAHQQNHLHDDGKRHAH